MSDCKNVVSFISQVSSSDNCHTFSSFVGRASLLMNPLTRRRLPPSIRSLLTDIAPKEEWTDVEPDTVRRDGILLPARAAAPEQEELLTPAETRVEGAAEDSSSSRRPAVCMLCKSKPSHYTCPRCNLQYCGLSCYQSPEHSTCSEEFYKESVLQELKDMGKTESEGKKKMQEMLLGLRQEAERTDGGMESLLKEAGVVEDEAGEGAEGEAMDKVQIVELLSRLAALQESGGGSEAEFEAILRKLGEIGGEEVLPGEMDEEDQSAEAEPDMAERLAGLDIDKLSEEELWELLNNKEKEKFMGLMKDEALGDLIPLWKPWWEEHEEGGRPLVEVLQEEVEKRDVKTSQEVAQNQGESATKSKKMKVKKTEKENPAVPPISAKIPKLSSLCANPSPLVCYGLVNALFGYAFTLRLINNDTDSLRFEFCDMVLALSAALSSNRVFNSTTEALDGGETLIQSRGYLDKDDPNTQTRAVEAVAHIMTGRDARDVTGYCLSALSQLRSLLSQARTVLSKEGEEGAKRQKYFQALKKCEFFQAWVLDNEHRIRSLAIELWHECSRREGARSSMEREKREVEESLKKKKNKGTLIEVLN